MNKGYKQAVVEKKLSMAQKMGLEMNGKGTSYVGGMKYHGASKGSTVSGGMKPKLHGTGGKGKVPQKTPMSEKNPKVGDSIYTQANK